jgi:hypothetical protein
VGRVVSVVLQVSPTGYVAAAQVLGDGIAERARLVWLGLQAALDATGAMAGSEDVGTNWGASYDAAAAAAQRATQDVCNACTQLAAALEQSAINYEGADAASIPGAPARATANRWTNATTTLGEVQTAIGQGVPQPGGWSLLQHAIGYLWPNGHQDLLRAAAGAWRRAASQLDDLLPSIGGAAREVMLQRAPESADAFTVVDAMTGHVVALASSYRALSSACDDYAAHLDHAHHEIISEITRFVEWTAGIEAAGGLFSICTFGLSEAAAQVGEGAEIARAAAAIRSVIETLRSLVSAGRDAIEAASMRVMAIADGVNPILAVRIERAEVEQVNAMGALRPGLPLPGKALPTAMATTREGAALDKLNEAANLPELTISRERIEAKFAHAGEFGVNQSRGRRGFEAFEASVRRFVADGSTKRIVARYLGDQVILSYNIDSRLVVIQKLTGEFVSGWRMSGKQLRYVLRLGVLGGH